MGLLSAWNSAVADALTRFGVRPAGWPPASRDGAEEYLLDPESGIGDEAAHRRPPAGAGAGVLGHLNLRRLKRSRCLAIVCAVVLAALVVLHVAAPRRPAAATLRLMPGAAGDSCFVSVLDAYRQDLGWLQEPTWTGWLQGAERTSNTFDDSGHLVVGAADSPHPIPELLARGEHQWAEMTARQSQNVSAAEAEYRRRYKHEPPRLFARWFQYAQDNGALLPDEFDNLDANLAPFRALSPSALRDVVEASLTIPQVYILDIAGGKVSRTRNKDAPEWAVNWRGNSLQSLIEPFLEDLPDMKIVVSSYDEPTTYVPWSHLQQILDGKASVIKPQDDEGRVVLTDMCSPDSHANRKDTHDQKLSFVYDSVAAGDACKNPYLLDSHGMFLQPHDTHNPPRPYTELLPIFSMSTHPLNSDILFTPTDQVNIDKGDDPAWKDKDSLLSWRGSTTGMPWLNDNVPWRKSHRIRLHQFANNASEASAEILVPDGGGAEGSLGFTMEEVSAKESSEFFFDMRLSKAIQCDEPTCDAIKDTFEMNLQSKEELNKHKFLYDIDGNAWSGRFRRLMSTNSMIIKSTIFPEWFTPSLVPWFMYVPSRMDFIDLTAILAFFRGSPAHPDRGFDATAQAIAVNGRCFVDKLYRHEDMRIYMFRLLIEWADILERVKDAPPQDPEEEPQPEPQPEEPYKELEPDREAPGPEEAESEPEPERERVPVPDDRPENAPEHAVEPEPEGVPVPDDRPENAPEYAEPATKPAPPLTPPSAGDDADRNDGGHDDDDEDDDLFQW